MGRSAIAALALLAACALHVPCEWGVDPRTCQHERADGDGAPEERVRTPPGPIGPGPEWSRPPAPPQPPEKPPVEVCKGGC